MSQTTAKRRITIERSYRASLADLWELWTTKEGIESWWGPDGFATKVLKLDLRPGGELIYLMTAVGAGQVEFMKSVGMPLTTECRVRYTDVVVQRQLGYVHLADFIPGVEPYDVASSVEFHSTGDLATMVLTFDAMHDEEWTQRSVMGEESQLARLEKVIAGR